MIVSIFVEKPKGKYLEPMESPTTIDRANPSPSTQVTIRLSPGEYREKVSILGPSLDSRGLPTASIVWDDCAGKVDTLGELLGTFRTQTFVIEGADFRAERIRFVNAGPSVFSNCTIIGHVDFGNRRLLCRHRTQVPGTEDLQGYVCTPSTREGSLHGFLFLACRIVKANSFLPLHSFALGRP